MIYITGDTHRNFKRVRDFCEKNNTSKEDVLIILGDAGINYYLDESDLFLKEELQELPITLFCIRGNHEVRPDDINTYEIRYWHSGNDRLCGFWDRPNRPSGYGGGAVFVEPDFPNLIFAQDGETYYINNKKFLVIGGAYSIDKWYRISHGLRWFKNEQLRFSERVKIEKEIKDNNYSFDYILSHTCPYNTRPEHLFLKGVNQNTVDTTMEKWLQDIADKINFKRWYFGHYHGDWDNGKYSMLYEKIVRFE